MTEGPDHWILDQKSGRDHRRIGRLCEKLSGVFS